MSDSRDGHTKHSGTTSAGPSSARPANPETGSASRGQANSNTSTGIYGKLSDIEIRPQDTGYAVELDDDDFFGGSGEQDRTKRAFPPTSKGTLYVNSTGQCQAFMSPPSGRMGKEWTLCGPPQARSSGASEPSGGPNAPFQFEKPGQAPSHVSDWVLGFGPGEGPRDGDGDTSMGGQ